MADAENAPAVGANANETREAWAPIPDKGVFAGREREVEELQRALGEVDRNGGCFYLVSGPAGIGKTRIAQELANRAASQGWSTHWGRSWDAASCPEYWPWGQIFRSYCSQLGERPVPWNPRISRRIAKLVPDFADKLGAPLESRSPDAAIGAESDRTHLFNATVEALKHAADDNKIFLVFDDLHAADRSSLSLLRFLAEQIRTLRIFVLGTWRHPETSGNSGLESEFETLGRATAGLPLPALDESAVEAMVRYSIGVPRPQWIARRLRETTGGNPFFIIEILRHWRLQPRSDSATFDIERFPIPPNIIEMVRHRIGALSTSCTRMLRIAAVAGREFDLNCLARAGCGPTTELRSLAEEGERALIISRNGQLTLRYVFSHALVRDALYQDLPVQERLDAHAAIARALEDPSAPRTDHWLSELAYHFGEIAAARRETLPDALTYLLQAAQRATQNAAYEDAALLYERAIELYVNHGYNAAADYCEALLCAGDARNRAGDSKRARATYEKAAAVADQHSLTVHFARAILGVAGFWPTPGIIDQSIVDRLETALARLDGNDPLRPRVMSRLALEVYSSERERATELARNAVGGARLQRDRQSLIYTLLHRHLVEMGPDNLEERISIIGELADLAREISDRELSLEGHLWSMANLLEAGDLRPVRDRFVRYAPRIQEFGLPRLLWYLGLFRVTFAFLEGRYDEIEKLAQETYEAGRSVQPLLAEIVFGMHMGLLRQERGFSADSEPLVRLLVDQYPQHANIRCDWMMMCRDVGRLSEVRLELERFAASEFEELPRDAVWLGSIAILAETTAWVEETSIAPKLYELLRPYENRCVSKLPGGPWLGPVSRYLGLLAGACRLWPQAERHLENAISVTIRAGARPLCAYARCDLADVLLSRGQVGDENKAQKLLKQSEDTADALGMVRLKSRITEVRLKHPAGLVPHYATAIEPHPVNRLRRDGDSWAVVYGGKSCHVRDAKGLSYIAHLIRSPGEDIHVVTLASLGGPMDGAVATEGSGVVHEGLRVGSGHAGEMLDTEAKQQYKERLNELRADLEEANRVGDSGASARVRREMEFLEDELSAAFGLGGRPRRASDDVERVRKAVTNRIRHAISTLRSRHEKLADHLTKAIRMGTFCSYSPGTAINWNLD